MAVIACARELPPLPPPAPIEGSFPMSNPNWKKGRRPSTTIRCNASKPPCAAPSSPAALPSGESPAVRHAYEVGVKTTDEQDTQQWGGGATMPQDSAARKRIPIVTGLLDYFPDALIAVAEVSFVGNEKHNPGEPLHWARGKGGNNIDEAGRHIVERGKVDDDGLRHLAKAGWRILAALQLEIEAARARGEPK